LGVFVGGCTLAAATAVSGAATLADLTSLVEQNLLRQETNGTPEPRFTMLEMIRAYALERLDDADERAELRQYHARYYLALAQAMEEDKAAWLARMGLEHDNLRAALQWFIDQREAEPILRLSSILRWFWESNGYQREGRRWLNAALALDHEELDPILRIDARIDCGTMAWQLGDFASGWAFLSEALELSRRAELPDLIACTQQLLARVAIEQGDYDQAVPLLNESLALSRELGTTADIEGALLGLGEVALAQGDYARTEALCWEGVALERDMTLEQALRSYLQYVLLRQNLAEIALVQGNYPQALAWLTEGLALGREFKHVRSLTLLLAYSAAVIGTAPERNADDVWRAARIWGAVEALRNASGLSFNVAHRTRLAHYLELARTGLDPLAWSTAWAEGRAMSLEQTIECALNV
jgi:tetratricopeptide (TPR) repeat protein